MYNIYSALSSTASDYGINTLKVFYDTIMLGVKCKDDGINHSYYGHILLDKINYNYTDYPLQSNKSIILNIGLINSDIVSYTGNSLIDVFFNQNDKEVTIFTLSGLNHSFMPRIYKYNINNHDIKLVYPLNDDKLIWETSSLGSLTSTQIPLLSIADNKADLLITSVTDNVKILNVLTFDITTEVKLINYSKFSTSLDSMNVIRKIQRVENELHFYSSTDQNITPFKIVDK